VASMAGAPQGQPAPQQMAQGLPEETGIGALPVPNMRGMAAGGIVAFGDGGVKLPGEEFLRSTNGGQSWALDAPDTVRNPAVPFYQEVANPAAVLKGKTFGSRDEALSAYRKAMTSGTPDMSSVRATESAMDSGIQRLPTRPGASAAAAQMDANGPVTTSAADSVASVNAPTGAPRPTATGARVGTAKEAPVDLQTLFDSMMPKEPVADPYATENAQNATDRNAINEGKRTVAKERAEGLAALLTPKEQRIKDKEERLKKSDDMNVNMSLINAGLAMMQSRGQGLAGIAEGAGVGVKQYSEGLKLSEAARQKIEDAKDAFDELKFNQTNMSKKEIADAEAAVKEGAIVSRNEGIASRQKATGEKRADVKAVFEAKAAQLAEKDRQQFQREENIKTRDNALKVAGVSANAGTAAKIDMLERLGAADPKSPLYIGYMMTVQEGQEPKMYSDYQTKALDPMQGEAFKKQYPTFELYKAGMSGGGGNFVKPPTGVAAPVRER